MEMFRARAYLSVSKTTPRPDAEGGPWQEPAEAADWAESWLENSGMPGESFVDIYFNGQTEIHTSVYLLERDFFGIQNSKQAPWPMSYLDDGNGMDLDSNEPDPFGRDLAEWKPGDSDTDEISDDSDVLDLGNDGSEDDEGSEDEGDDEDDSEADGENEDDDGDSEKETEGDEGNDDDGEGEGEEMPRVKVFAKLRGPKGWRKRAESDSERELNRFGVKIGVLNDDPDLSAARQERDVRVEILFEESDNRRDAGQLVIRLPEGVELKPHKKRNWFTVEIPYHDHDNS